MTSFFAPYRSDKSLLWFTLAWLAVNLLQAIFTELAHDEAYYWMYSRYLNIGYYDHPPMIAAMIKVGTVLLSGEIGVRILVVVGGALLIRVMYELTDRKDFALLALLLCGSTVFNIYGFIAVPDAPLLLFTALFFLCYRNYLNKENVANVILLALAVAGLLYSKYHGLLIVFFTVCSNPALFRRKSFYAIIIAAIVCYLPHILWQVNNNYPSYQYHIANKSQSPYNPLDTLEFIGGTLMVAGPLIGGFLLYAFWKNKEKDLFRRALRFTFYGFVLFFLFSTLNAPIEANWMAASVVPLMILAHEYISENEKVRKWTIRMAVVSLVLFSFERVNLMTDIVPAVGSKVLPEFYGWKEWTQLVTEKAEGCPVVILNSYQRASKYGFYSGTDGLSLNNVSYRRNQYDLWNIGAALQGKRVAVFAPYWEGVGGMDTFSSSQGKMMVGFVDDYTTYSRVMIKPDLTWYHFAPGQKAEMKLTFTTGDTEHIDLGAHPLHPVTLVVTQYYMTEYDKEIELMKMDSVVLVSGMELPVSFITPEKPGPYYLRFSLRNGWISPYINSDLVRMDVE